MWQDVPQATNPTTWILTCSGSSRQIKHAKVDNKDLCLDSTVLYSYSISYALSNVTLREIYWSPVRCSHLPPSHLPFHPALALGGQSLDHIAVFPAAWILVWVCKRKTPTGDRGTGGQRGSVKVVTSSSAQLIEHGGLCFSQRGDIFCPEAHFYPLQWEANNPEMLVSLLSIKLMHVSVYLYVVVVVKFTWSCLTLCDPMNSCQGPLSMEFPRQEYWSG